MENSIFKLKGTDKCYKLKKLRENNINTFIECDYLGNTIIKKRCWSTQPQEQVVIITGFDKLEKCD